MCIALNINYTQEMNKIEGIELVKAVREYVVSHKSATVKVDLLGYQSERDGETVLTDERPEEGELTHFGFAFTNGFFVKCSCAYCYPENEVQVTIGYFTIDTTVINDLDDAIDAFYDYIV